MSDDSDGPLELTRRRVLGGIVTMGAASAAAGAGTVALFDDQERSSGNTVSAGTIDLTLGDSSGNVVMDIPDVVPDSTGSDSHTLRNSGTLPGYLQVAVTGFRNPENGVNEPEADDSQESDPEGPDSGDEHSGELAQNLELRMKLVNDGSEEYLVGSSASLEKASTIHIGPRDIGEFKLDSGETVDFVTEYEVYNAGNEIQSDGLEIDLVFGLAQEPNQTLPPEPRDVAADAVGPGDDKAGVRFDYTNEFSGEVTITDVHVQPEDEDLILLSDGVGGTDYDDYSYNSDVHIETPISDQDGWVDGGQSEFDVPGWISLGVDGWNDDADQEAKLSPGNTGSVHLYAFRNRSHDKVASMAGKSLRVTLDIRLNDGTKKFVPLVMTPN